MSTWMLHHGSEDYDPSLSFCTVPGFAEDLGFWKCRGTRRFMHNDAPDAATLDWVDWRWIFMQVITCSSLSDSFCAREPGPKSMLLTTPKPAGGLQGCLKQGSVRKRVSYGILCASLDREVRAGTVCAITWRPPPRILELVEFRCLLESAETVRRRRRRSDGETWWSGSSPFLGMDVDLDAGN